MNNEPIYSIVLLTTDEANKVSIYNAITDILEEALNKLDRYNEQYVIRFSIEKVDKHVG